MRFGWNKQTIPWLMAAGRATLGPLLIAGAMCQWNGLTLASIVVGALVSDIFDGVLARRWGCDTAGVRLFDSMADTVFYVCTGVALWVGQPQVWREYGALLAVLLGLEVLRFAVDFQKFGKPASYHSYLAKTWGLVMATAVVAVFATRSTELIPVALGLGIACDLEGLAMSLMLPVWRKDVKTLAAAWRIRREMRVMRRGAVVSRPVYRVAAMVLVLAVSATACAAVTDEATYTDGTTAMKKGTEGHLDFTAGDKLMFRAGGQPAGTPAEIAIGYGNITDFEYHSPVMHQLGFLPMVAAGLLVKRMHRYLFTVTYKDASDTTQVAIFEVSRSAYPGFCAVLRARSPARVRGSCTSESR